jgi:hypothetical protein
MTRVERQKRNRSIEGHSAREAMLRYNRSEKHREAAKRCREATKNDPERHEAYLSKRRKGTRSYAAKVLGREASIVVAENHRQRWTLEEVCKLEAMRKQQVPTWEIALALKRSLQGVEHKIQKLGLTRKEST